MKVIVAPDSFKGCLPAGEVAGTVAAALRERHPDWTVVELPLADGGEGTLDIVTPAIGGTICRAQVHDPLGRLVLLAQTLGLNTCWVGLTYRKVPGAFTLRAGDIVHCVISLGYGVHPGGIRHPRDRDRHGGHRPRLSGPGAQPAGKKTPGRGRKLLLIRPECPGIQKESTSFSCSSFGRLPVQSA